LRGSLPHAFLEHGDFLNSDISQGRIATHLRHGEILNKHFTANFLTKLTVKEFEN